MIFVSPSDHERRGESSTFGDRPCNNLFINQSLRGRCYTGKTKSRNARDNAPFKIQTDRNGTMNAAVVHLTHGIFTENKL